MTPISQDELDQVADTLHRALAPRFTPEHLACVADAGWDEQLWRVLEDAGLTLVAADADLGEAGGAWPVAAEVARLAGRYAALAPVIETQVAAWLLTQTGAEVEPGPMSVGLAGAGVARRIPYGRIASVVVVADAVASTLRVLRPDGAVLEEVRNLAGEPRADLAIGPDCSHQSRSIAAAALAGGMALLRVLRAAQLAGAAEQCLELTVGYVQERQQFGRALGKFQSVQQQLAMMAGEVALARAAVDGAVVALADAVAGGEDLDAAPSHARLAVDSAKAQAGIAAGRVARVAHQLHGAIGTTREHRLHLATTRLWAWSAEDGSAQQLCETIGAQTLAAPSASLWPMIAR
jgi:acyl-CoA dehydrogenase